MALAPAFNSYASDWIQFVIAFVLAILNLFLTALIRFLSGIALRINTERTLLKRRNEEDGHVIIGEVRWLSLLGAPHVVRARTSLGFSFLLVVVIGTTALSIASAAFSGLRKLRTGSNTPKITALPGPPVTGEDELKGFSDWFKSSGVVSFCQQRAGAKRIFFQPFVETKAATKVFCGKRLDIKVVHESETRIELIRPSRLVLKKLEGVTTSTPDSNFWVHEIDYLGKSLLGVCNSGEFYRGIRFGQISQTCAFATKTSLILGGYVSNDTAKEGPGKQPEMNDIRYYDSYETQIGTELNQKQLMQALTLWDLGAMSEIEVAALSTLRPQLQEGVPSFEGGYERLQVEIPMLVVGLSVALATIVFLMVYIMWDRYDRPQPQDRLDVNVTSLEFISQMMGIEVRGEYGVPQKGTPLNRLGLRDVTQHARNGPNPPEEGQIVLHLGSYEIPGIPTNMGEREVVANLNNCARREWAPIARN